MKHVKLGNTGLELTEEEIRRLEEPYVPHAVTGFR